MSKGSGTTQKVAAKNAADSPNLLERGECTDREW